MLSKDITVEILFFGTPNVVYRSIERVVSLLSVNPRFYYFEDLQYAASEPVITEWRNSGVCSRKVLIWDRCREDQKIEAYVKEYLLHFEIVRGNFNLGDTLSILVIDPFRVSPLRYLGTLSSHTIFLNSVRLADTVKSLIGVHNRHADLPIDDRIYFDSLLGARSSMISHGLKKNNVEELCNRLSAFNEYIGHWVLNEIQGDINHVKDGLERFRNCPYPPQRKV